MFDGVRQLAEQDINSVSTTKNTSLGAVGMTADNRRFRYVSFGGTTTVPAGQLMQAAVGTSNSTGLVITAAGTGGQVAANFASGSQQLVLTNGSTAVTLDQFSEGFIEILQTSGSNEGPISYRIRGNTAAAASTGYITVYLAEALRNPEVLVAGTDTANIWRTPYSLVLATTTVNVPIGINTVQVVNSSTVTNYGWVQSGGPVMGIQDGSSMVIGNTVGASTTTAGNVGLAVAATKPAIGWSRQTVNTGGNAVSIVLNIS